MTGPAQATCSIYAETTLSNSQKANIVDRLGNATGLKRHRDWGWHSVHQATSRYIDIDELPNGEGAHGAA